MNMRKQIIAQYEDMCIDMDYVLCIPSIHARYMNEDIVIDYSGKIREKSRHFPEDKEKSLVEWVEKHEAEIIENHRRCGQGDLPLILIY